MTDDLNELGEVPEPVDFTALESELTADGPIIESSNEAMHLFMAASQVVQSLHPDPVVETLTAIDPELMDPVSLKVLLSAETSDDERHKLVDRLGDFAKVMLRELGGFMEEHGMGDARFIVFLPCHMGNATLFLKDEKTGVPSIKEW